MANGSGHKLKSKLAVTEMAELRERGHSYASIARAAGISGVACWKLIRRAQRALQTARAPEPPRPAFTVPGPASARKCPECGMFCGHAVHPGGLCSLCEKSRKSLDEQRRRDLEHAKRLAKEKEARQVEAERRRKLVEAGLAAASETYRHVCVYCGRSFTTASPGSLLCDSHLLQKTLGVLPENPVDPLSDTPIRPRGCSLLIN